MIPTLEIIYPDLPGAKMIINEADFDPSRHQRYREPKGRKRSPEYTPVQSEDRSPEHTPAEPQEQSPLVSDLPHSQSPEPTHDLSEDLSPEPISDLPEDQSPEQTPKGPADQPSPTRDLSEEQSPEPTLSEAQPPTYTQSDLEAKNITALRAIAAEKRIPRRMKLSRDELLQAILGVGNGDRESDGVGG